MSELAIHRVLSAGEAEFRGLLSIYEEAIPVSERKSMSALAEMVARPEYVFLTISDENGVVGFSISICFDDAALLEYMAVDRAQREKGIGAKLFRRTVELPELSERFVLIEVDSDTEVTEDHEQRVRRKNFYRRLGCRHIEGLRYRMPRLGSEEPPPMDMLIYRRPLPDHLEIADARRWIGACYTHVYGQPSSDPRLAAMFSELGPQMRLI